MTDIEVKTSENVINACTRTPSVNKCVLTSSLLACIWRNLSQQRTTPPVIINHNSWSDESICVEKKVGVCDVLLVIILFIRVTHIF